MDSYASLRGAIRDYRYLVETWWRDLQKDHISEWLFITTLACWGVPNPIFQVTGFCLTMAFFFGKINKINRCRGTFPEIEKKLTKKIEQSQLSEEDKARLRADLIAAKNNRNIVSVLRKTWRFCAAYTFLTVSFVSALTVAFLSWVR